MGTVMPPNLWEINSNKLHLGFLTAYYVPGSVPRALPALSFNHHTHPVSCVLSSRLPEEETGA